MESTDSSAGPPQPNLPPGFRFHPTDEELVVHYLKKKINSSPLPVSIIAEVDLYKFDPWELPAKATFGEQEWYFFSPRERKYPNGARPNRAATSGYWKATGTDKPVLAAGGNNQKVGVKKALVFYGGKPPKGIKTNWIMHEYRLAENKPSINKPPGYDLANKKNSLRLDDWVLCRIYKKNNSHRPIDHEREDSMDDMMGSIPPSMRLNLPKLGMNYGALLENDQNLLEGMMANDGVNSTNSSISHLIPSSSSSKPADLSAALKRQTPSSLFWNEDDDQSGISSKRLQFDNSDGTVITRTDNGHNSSSSLATLLSNLPQTPPLHHQNVLGSLGDGLFRAPYQIPGSNWYS